jgi:hypothetical protein
MKGRGQKSLDTVSYLCTGIKCSVIVHYCNCIGKLKKKRAESKNGRGYFPTAAPC